MNKLMFTVVLAATSGALYAQEMGAAQAADNKATTTVTVAATATEGDTTVSIVATAKESAQAGGAVEIVNKVVEAAPKMAAADTHESVSAEELVEKKLGLAGLTSGFDRKRRAIIQIGVGSVKVENPPADPNFMLIREGIAQYAYMNAKADIIRSINTEFSAIDRVMTKSVFGEDETAQKFAIKKAELEGKRDQLVTMLKDVQALTSEDEEAVKSVCVGERFGILMDAVIKKVDSQYDPKVLEAKKQVVSEERKARLAKLRAECNTVLAEYKQLEAEANALNKEPALEAKSDVKLLSEMPLLGSSVLSQAETWDPEEKIFTIAMAVVWSPSLQDQAIRAISDDFKVMNLKGKYSVKDWIEAQEFSHMAGPRRFTDKDGVNLFVGVSSVDLKMPVVKQNAAKKLADAMAMKNVAFSLSGDLATYREASQNLKVYENDANGANAKLKDAVDAQVSLNLNGCMRLAGKTVIHPLLNRKIYVSAYYIDPALAKEAKAVMLKLFNDAGLARLVTKQKQAYARGAQEMLKRVNAMTIEPVFVASPNLPPLPPMPKLAKPVGKLTPAENAAAKKALEEHKAKLSAQQKMVEGRSKQIEAEKSAAQDQAKQLQLEKEHQLLEQRKQKIEQERAKTQAILQQLYKAVDSEVDTNF